MLDIYLNIRIQSVLTKWKAYEPKRAKKVYVCAFLYLDPCWNDSEEKCCFLICYCRSMYRFVHWIEYPMPFLFHYINTLNDEYYNINYNSSVVFEMRILERMKVNWPTSQITTWQTFQCMKVKRSANITSALSKSS